VSENRPSTSLSFASLPVGLALRLVMPFGFGFFLSMFTRAMSNLVKQPIQQDLGLGEEAISLALGTAFFVTFALAQIPVGVLLDRYDPRRVNAGLFLVAAAGALLMGFADSPSALAAGRVLMGLGFAAGLMASLTTYALWFPRDRLPTLNSLQFMIGVLGSWSATRPVEWMLQSLDWREIYHLFAALTVLAALLIASVPPRYREHRAAQSLAEQLAGVMTIFRNRYFWRITPLMCIGMGISQGLGTLYVYSWLTDVSAFDGGRAATAVGWVTLVSAANFALLGPLAEYLGRRGVGPLFLPVAGQLLSLVLLCLLAAQVHRGAIPLWMLYTVAAGTSTLSFSALAQVFPLELIGRAYTAFNLLGFLTTASAQWLVGYVLDLYPRTSLGASPEGYQSAFFMLAAVQLAAAVWFAWASRPGRARA
jgi:MFS family permease